MRAGRHSAATPASDSAPRLEARVCTLEDLLRDVLALRLRAPDHATSKWTPEDAERLLDSIHRGYPIGTLLIWQQPDAGWVVDGQQRVRALTRVLAGAGLGADAFALHFDLESGRIARLVHRKQQTPRHLPLTEVLDTERLHRWLRDLQGPDASAALRFGERLRDYPITAHIIHTDDAAIVRDIYRRLHAAGHPMRERAVFDAIATARHGSRPRRLGELSDALADLNFGTFAEPLLVSSLRALHGPDVDRPTRDQLTALDRAMHAVVQFLRHDAGVPHRTFVPDDFPVIVLASFFARFPDAHPRSRELLARWLWRQAVAGPAPPLRVPQILDAVRRGDETAAVQALLASVPRTPLPDLPLRPFAPATLRGRILSLALFDLGPLHLTHATPLGPETPLRQLPRVPAEWRHDLASRIFHTSDLRGPLAAIVRCTQPAVLASHAISPAAHACLQRGDQAGFLAARAATLSRLVHTFLARHTRWEQSDRPPLAALEIGDED